MNDALEMTLRRRFAQAERPAADEGFVDRLRLQRRRHVRRLALLRGLLIGAMLLAAAVASRLLLPWVTAALQETEAWISHLLQGPHSVASLVLVLAVAGASVIGFWARGQVAPRD